MSCYYRPILQVGPGRPKTAHTMGGGWTWFTHVERLSRSVAPQVLPADEIPNATLNALTAPRAAIGALSMLRPNVMGILNVTPDSFSDGGQHHALQDALAGVERMAAADIVDIGGESTRPGAAFVPDELEIERTVPVIEALRTAGFAKVISIDTRKASVARAATRAGADLVNDVSGFTFDKALAPFCAKSDVPVCIMHAQGDPATMQDDPQYDNVLLDVFDFLDGQIKRLVAQGIDQNRIIVDPGIGFGKTLDHNLALLSRLSLFHSLGVPVLLGASRKKFIGTVGQAPDAADRMPGSVAVALAALKHGTQIVRVHDVPETAQAIALWQAVVAGQLHE